VSALDAAREPLGEPGGRDPGEERLLLRAVQHAPTVVDEVRQRDLPQDQRPRAARGALLGERPRRGDWVASVRDPSVERVVGALLYATRRGHSASRKPEEGAQLGLRGDVAPAPGE
jgi:hypothetical protein